MRAMSRARSLRLAVATAVLLLFIPGALPARAETRIEQNLKLEPGGKLVLDADAGSVNVKGTSRSGARVLVTSQRDDLKDRFDFKFEEGAGTVTITAKKKGGL